MAPPRSFKELIGQLDELNRSMKAGGLMTASNVAAMKSENEKLKKSIEEVQDRCEMMTQNFLKREAEWVHFSHIMREELADLRNFRH
jgi:soluble cytochrome b562